MLNLYLILYVKQGDNLAPVLFLFVVQAVIKSIHVNWSSINATLYADNSAFIFLSKSDLRTGATFVKNTFAQFGLKVQLGCTIMSDLDSKTEAMYFPAHSKHIE